MAINRARLEFWFHHSSIFVLALLFIQGHSFGVSPQDFFRGDIVEVKANKLASVKTQVPYSYYSIPYCRPHRIVDNVENLGEILRGDHIQNSLYQFRMRVTTMCNIVCRITLDEKSANEFKEKIDDEYRANMLLDDLPLVVFRTTIFDSSPVYQLGYFVGGKARYDNATEEKYFINNHLSFVVKYHHLDMGSARIIGFEVNAFSVNHKYDGEWSHKTRLTTCDPRAKRFVKGSDPPQEVDDKKEIIFTYDVKFEETDIKWPSRWDTYLLLANDHIHWFSLVNSLMIVLSISGMVAMIMLRALHRDIIDYDQLQTLEEAQEQTCRKLVQEKPVQVKPPVDMELLCVFVGTGVQIFGAVSMTIIFKIIWMLSPSTKSELMTIILHLWALMGIVGGLAMARLYKTFGGSEWNIKATLKTACMFPGTVFCILVVLNVLTCGEESRAIPFDTMLGISFLWLGVSVPLVFFGSYIGFKEPEIEDSVKTIKIPKQIYRQTWYMNPYVSIMMGGILPFGAVFNELFYMITSIGLHQFYYVFGFTFVVLIITCAEITILLCYFQSRGEDYQWWWQSYLTAGSSGFYLFIYATFYFFTKLNITELVPGILYFGYMFIASCAVFVLTGTIGFYACLWFPKLVYSPVTTVAYKENRVANAEMGKENTETEEKIQLMLRNILNYFQTS